MDPRVASFLFTASFLATTSLVTGCTERVEGVPQRTVESTPAAEKIAPITAPEAIRKPLLLVFPKKPIDVKDLDLSFAPEPIRRGAGVIIDIPEYEKWQREQKRQKEESDRRGLTQTAPAPAMDPRSAEEESTGGNFSLAQQEFERALLTNGFKVLDRKKFEAKLRDARDSGPRNYLDGGQRKVFRSGFTEAKQALEGSFKDGRITSEEFTKRMVELEDQYAVGTEGGRNRKEDEMSDTAEVIRAALLGDKDEVKPDYLLQMRLKIPSTFPRPLNLQKCPEYTEFMTANEEFRLLPTYTPGKDEGGQSQGTAAFPTSIQTPWYYVEAETKLIDIKTGNVLWIGSIRTQSNNIEDFQLNYTLTRRVDPEWLGKATAEIKAYNSTLESLERNAAATEASLRSMLQRYSGSLEVESDQVLMYKANRESAIVQSEQAHQSARNALARHQEKRPAVVAIAESPRFLYSVSPLNIVPDLRSPVGLTDDAKQQRQEEIMAHKRKLLREAAQQLIGNMERRKD